MVIKFEITMTNKWLYSLMAIGVFLALGVGVLAYNPDMMVGNPTVMGHSAGEINVENSTRGVVSLQDELDFLNLETLDTGILDGKTESSSEENNLISQGCIKLNNEDGRYGSNNWMSCPKNFYVAAISDDWGDEQDVFCCPFKPTP